MAYKNLTTTLSLICLLSISHITSADSLIEVYQQALKNDPTYKQAEADWRSTKQDLPIAVAAALPLIEFDFQRGKAKYTTANKTKSHVNTQSYTLTATQPVIDFYDWKGITVANAEAKSATSTYYAAGLSLIQRTAKAYFQVLEDIATLKNTQATKEQYQRTMITNQKKYDVGLIAITDVLSAETNYDASVAQEIADQNTLASDLESLTAMTNKKYTSLTAIKDSIPLITPKPNNINDWITTATQQNFDLKAAQYTTQQAKNNIAYQRNQFLPTVDAVASRAYNYHTDPQTTDTAELTSTMYPFQGGLVLSETRQAGFDHKSAIAQEEYTRRNVIQNTRTDFLSINSNIQSINANQKAITSATQAYKASEAGYNVGTQTLEDVITNIAALSSAKQSYATAQYTYLNNLISLKLDAGTLTIDDLTQINSWLTASTDLEPLLKTITPLKSTTSTTTSAAASSSAPTKAGATNGYAIQVFATTKQEDAKQFLTQWNIPNYTIIKSNNLYKVVSPTYSTYIKAKEALSTANKKEPNAWIYKINA